MKMTMMKSVRRGFTLVELSVAIMLGMAIGSMVLMLFNQHLTFLKIYQAQGFLSDEAPLINIYVNRIVGRADRFRLHASLNDALAGTNARLTDSPVVVMNFRQPDGTMKASILAFQDLGSGSALYCYTVPTSGAMGSPWTVSNRPSNVSFAVDQGILRMTITGPAGERIIYSGAMQQ